MMWKSQPLCSELVRARTSAKVSHAPDQCRCFWASLLLETLIDQNQRFRGNRHRSQELCFQQDKCPRQKDGMFLCKPALCWLSMGVFNLEMGFDPNLRGSGMAFQ